VERQENGANPTGMVEGERKRDLVGGRRELERIWKVEEKRIEYSVLSTQLVH
jgi:hypothetical protein